MVPYWLHHSTPVFERRPLHWYMMMKLSLGLVLVTVCLQQTYSATAPLTVGVDPNQFYFGASNPAPCCRLITRIFLFQWIFKYCSDPSILMSLDPVRPMNTVYSQQHHSAQLLDIVLRFVIKIKLNSNSLPVKLKVSRLN